MLLFEVPIKLGSSYFRSLLLAGDSEANFLGLLLCTDCVQTLSTLRTEAGERRHISLVCLLGRKIWGDAWAGGEGRLGIAIKEGKESSGAFTLFCYMGGVHSLDLLSPSM